MTTPPSTSTTDADVAAQLRATADALTAHAADLRAAADALDPPSDTETP